MKIEFHNCPAPQKFETSSLPDKPAFLSYSPNFELMAELAEEFSKYKNLLLIGHGGSISSFYGIYSALKEQSLKDVYFLSTVDPDAICELKKTLTPDNTLVIAISKSGETVTQIEALMQFANFPIVAVTGLMGPLYEIASNLGAKIVAHPAIGGRYTGLTEVALLPATLCGFDVETIFKSAQKVYQTFNKTNDAFNSASIFYQLEEKGFVDVFMPVYDEHLFPFTSLIVQLCHESFGKDGEGQTYFAHQAPESQHHTNQRFFGGRKNIAGFFLATEKPLHDLTTTIPDNAKALSFKESTLGVLDGIPLSVSLSSELNGTLEDAKLKNIPVAIQQISHRTASEMGELLAFWQLYAVYSSLLRNVDPFDQPQVESSKKISFDKRLQYKGKL